MKQPTERASEYHDTSRIVRFVHPSKSETDPELLLYLCVPAVLVGTLFKMYQMYYIALFIACSSFLSCRYGEVNVQQYISLGMMIVMSTTLQFMQPQNPGSRAPPQGPSPQQQQGPPPQAAS
ncbi:hypothetical protein, conserved [Eimeria acervulina]|uniref:Uncharacterized protein n=1 Tax=Eimeria acervulina TaxID=5801 RepID=U6GRF9_EIMAC|nr:hypothetical protein, conserved [Eimeria acervulina]CDI82142.1 hypothetical protein, conserved [Eimeria acervulina]